MWKINREDSSEQCMIKNAAGFPGLSSKEPTYSAGNAGDAGTTPGEDPLKRGMETQPSILARRIPEEPSGLQSTQSQRAGT